VAGAALHLGELAARVVADAAQLLRVVAPRHDVEVRPDRGQPERVRLVQISVDPLLVDLVRARVACQRVHVAGALLEAAQVLGAVVQKEPLVVDVVARQQQAHRCRE